MDNFRTTSPDYRVLALDMALALNVQRGGERVAAGVLADAEAFLGFLKGEPVADE